MTVHILIQFVRISAKLGLPLIPNSSEQGAVSAEEGQRGGKEVSQVAGPPH